MLSDLQKEIKHIDKKYFVGHIRAHSGLSGPLHEGNALADALTKVITLNLHKNMDKAKNSRKIHHQNVAGLSYEFHIPPPPPKKKEKKKTRQIVKLCPNSPIFNPCPSLEVNP